MITYTNSKDTIYAPASSPQKSGVIIVRVSGDKTKHVIQSLGIKSLQVRYATLTDIIHPTKHLLIDKAIVVFYESPHSFTGEDVLEINIHGSRAVLNLLLDALSSIEGLRIAEPGEFSMRGFMNGKMDLTQIEGLADLIDAETEAQATQALKQMGGELKDLYENWRHNLLKAMSLVEACIDFPDEDIPQSIIDDASAMIERLKLEIGNHLEDNKIGEKIRDGLYITIIGPPNAGKSSLINKLAKRDIAIVSNIAGTTRDIIEVHLNIAGYPVTLADTAGIRHSGDAVESEGIKRTLARAQNADFKIVLLDSTNTPDNSQVLHLIDPKSIVLINKVDVNTDNPAEYKGAISISVKNDIGIDTVLKRLSNIAEEFFYNSQSTPLITRNRHRKNLANCLNSLNDFNPEKDIVLAAEDLRLAASSLGRITGKIDVESILGEIFSSFCIGK